MAEMEFWFEFASTYSHIAAQTIEARAAEAGVSVRWRPFLLGPIFAVFTPAADLLLAGFVGGTFAYLVGRRARRKGGA